MHCPHQCRLGSASHSHTCPLSLPRTATSPPPLPRDLEYAAFPAEYARGLLDDMHNDPSHNATWALFWSAHPGPDGVFTPEVYTDAHLAMLQAPALVRGRFGRVGRAGMVSCLVAVAPSSSHPGMRARALATRESSKPHRDSYTMEGCESIARHGKGSCT